MARDLLGQAKENNCMWLESLDLLVPVAELFVLLSTEEADPEVRLWLETFMVEEDGCGFS